MELRSKAWFNLYINVARVLLECCSLASLDKVQGLSVGCVRIDFIGKEVSTAS